MRRNFVFFFKKKILSTARKWTPTMKPGQARCWHADFSAVHVSSTQRLVGPALTLSSCTLLQQEKKRVQNAPNYNHVAKRVWKDVQFLTKEGNGFFHQSYSKEASSLRRRCVLNGEHDLKGSRVASIPCGPATNQMSSCEY